MIDATFVTLTYFTATLDGATNSAFVVKTGQGVDTVLDPGAALGWGFEYLGSASKDTFNIDGGADSFVTVTGGRGDDVFNLTTSGTVRVNYAYSWQGQGTSHQRHRGRSAHGDHQQ